MESQQLVDYIEEQLKAGHSEANLRPHLLAHGWSQTAVDDAFAQHRKRTESPRQDATHTLTAKPAKPKKERKHHVKATKWTRTRYIKLGFTVAALAVVVVAARGLMGLHRHTPPPVARKALTYRQMQTEDITLLGGAVALYAQNADSLPTTLAVLADGSMLLCGASCDSTTPEVSPLMSYKPENIKFMSYAPGLMAPDKETLYLVPEAKCAGKTKLGGADTNPRAMVILYAQAQGDSTTPRCVTL